MNLDIAMKNSDAIVREIDRKGFAVVEGVLSPGDTATVRRRLWDIIGALQRRGVPIHTPVIDHTADNIRVYDLPEHDPIFLDLLSDPGVLAMVRLALGEDILASNFTANIARPGARSMRIHSDMALVFPGPWLERWALNVIWCLDDAYDANGATRYLPGSQHFTTLADVPADAGKRTVAFEAPAGAAIVMDGRLWHTSGRNVTPGTDRALLFAYYTRSFIRPQICWHEALSAATAGSLSEEQRRLMGFGALANTHGVSLVALS